MQINFNAYDHDPSQGGAICFPLADYKVEITGAEPKTVKDNPNAGYLELSLTVGEGDLRGMVQKDRLNIFSTSEVAKRIAHSQLSAYCFAIGRPFVQDTGELLGGRCIVTIGPQADNDRYSDVKAVKCMDGTLPTRQTAVQPAHAQAAPQAPPAPLAPQLVQTAPPAAQQPPWNASGAPAAPAWANSAATAPPAGSAPGAVPPWAKA